ncbi:bifunctional hydroxymethylpyrimidine kinase/phosphomethylpyrimidine kinase [Mangrovibrevibacter kandeliae]|uniref:bifunctional hydroxymethylpyrimidine kinase/phosphomethylpyrimidine kinase n=1 Tax=Mangrovibrevibacter kandeliae TaxID=2968473 RepID=UPI0021198152|nr:PfkB family carbohydrate kinase [Aurantimonas sp. CSK15Z-1]MCQ8781199.1 hydroxymethylpyrimidine/phosphomethylpyrimidine kinase [Aurantimonas sp. CSK15Z-1]
MRPLVLAIGGSDSSGGAGIAADIRAAHDLGADLRLALTAVTVQSERSVRSVLPVPPDILAEQVATALLDKHVGAVKIGMLGTAEAVAAVADALAGTLVPVVLDPVLAATSGGRLLDADGLALLLLRLLPRATLLTPNLPELAILGAALGFDVSAAGQEDIAAGLLSAGAGAVLVKGGHAEGAVARDRLFRPSDGAERAAVHHAVACAAFEAPRLAVSMRGTGCTLATAIAVELARGAGLPDACRTAKAYLEERLVAAARTAS